MTVTATSIPSLQGFPPLYEFQQESLDHILKFRKTILADQQGLGKTIVAGHLLEYLQYDEKPLERVLILGTRAAIMTWRRMCRQFWGFDPTVIVGGTPTERLQQWHQPGLLLSTHATFLRDFEQIPFRGRTKVRTWDVIIADEVHRYLRNRNNKVHKELRRHTSDYTVLMTGTPAKRGGQDMFGYFNILRPEDFSSYWRFIADHFEAERTAWGNEIIGLSDRKAFVKMIANEGLMVRHTKGDPRIRAQLPPKIVQAIYVEATPTQRSAYDRLQDDLFVTLNSGDFVFAPTQLTAFIRLRQLLITPKIFGDTAENGAGLNWIISDLTDRPDAGRHAVIYTLYRKAIPHIQKALIDAGLNPSVIITGGMTVDQLEEATQQFRNDPTSIAIVSLMAAESFELETATHAYFLGFSGTAGTNEQAEDRLHRLITCLLYTSPSPRDRQKSRMPSSA